MAKTKKETTINDLARMVTARFGDIRKEMATKQDIEHLARTVSKGFEQTAAKQELNELRKEMRDGFTYLNQAIENLDVRISSYSTEWNKRFDKLYEWVEQIEDRLKTLERHLTK